MNPTRSVYRTADVHQLLAETVRHLADAREFYRHAARSVLDAEIRQAFAFCAEAQSALLESLQPAVPAAGAVDERQPSVFAVVAGQFDGRRPQAAARELHKLDMDLMQRIEALFANYPDMNVRAALKKHVLTIQRAGDATRRLALRNVA